MFRGTLLAFVLGWGLWFWIDKNPASLGPVPYPRDGSLLQNFQVAIDLIKQVRFKAAFVYIWKAHYLVLSVAFGLLLGILGGFLSSAWSRRRLIRLYAPARKTSEDDKQ